MKRVRTVAGQLAVVIMVAVAGSAGLAQTAGPAKPKSPPPAQTVLKTALSRAAAEHKNVFVHFGASWCTWCHKLTAVIESPVVGKTFGEFFVVAELTVQEVGDKKPLENAGGSDLLKQWAGDADAPLPYYVFLDSAGRKLADANAMPDGTSTGYPGSTPEGLKAFELMLAKTAPKMTAESRHAIIDYMATHK